MKNRNSICPPRLLNKTILAVVFACLVICPIGKPLAWSQDQPSFVTIHDAFAQIGMKVSGFGGAFVDEAGDTLYVYLVPDQPGDPLQVNEAITEVLGTARPPEHNLGVLAGQYTFLELQDWYDNMSTEVLSIPGVVLTAMHDTRNRLRVGVENDAAASAVQEKLVALGIPLDAVEIERARPVRLQKSVQDRIRPLVGGLEIENDNTEISTFTLSAISLANDNKVPGFVTCSHCADTAFKLTGTKFYQNEKKNANLIGVEAINPPLVPNLTCGEKKRKCPDGDKCRCSDALFGKYEKDIDAKRGFIARTKEGLDKTWNGTDYFRITAKGPFMEGTKVIKVGRTTGRTEGKIIGTCVATSQTGSGRVLCLDEAAYKSGEGDSGAPVFVITNKPENNDVSVTGVHLGATDDGNAFFSEIRLVEDPKTELGPLAICAPPAAC